MANANDEVYVSGSRLAQPVRYQSGWIGWPEWTPYSIRKAIDVGTKKRDYSNITVPILYLPASPPSARGRSQYYLFKPQNAEQRAELQRIYDADRVYLNRYESNMRTAKGGVRIVELHAADHYVYFTNERQVLGEIRRFAVKVQ